MKSLSIAYNMKRRKRMAEGGPVPSPSASPKPHDPFDIVNTQTPESNEQSSRTLATRKRYAEGGDVTDGIPVPELPDDSDTMYATREAKLNQHAVAVMDSHLDGIVDRIMRERSKDMSGTARLAHGGMSDGDEQDDLADFAPNEFDVMEMEPGLTAENSGKSDGDMLGDKQEQKDRHDVVMRAMLARKKSRMPRPA